MRTQTILTPPTAWPVFKRSSVAAFERSVTAGPSGRRICGRGQIPTGVGGCVQSTACGDVSAAAIGRFPFPSEREITLAVRNSNNSLGPVMLHLKMRPGSVIPAHIHDGVAEVLYIVEGGFMNEGRPHAVGTSLHVKADQSHGPHPTKNG